jgi:ankyrin repeat protein
MSTETGIFEAIEADDLERVKNLASDNPEIGRAQDEQGISAVMQARYHGRTEIVDLLLSYEPELNVFEAAAMGRRERAAALVERDPELVRAWSPDGFTALHFACFFGHPDIAGLLLERGADVDVPSRNELGVTPLQSAASGGHVRAAELSWTRELESIRLIRTDLRRCTRPPRTGTAGPRSSSCATEPIRVVPRMTARLRSISPPKTGMGRSLRC